MDPRVSKLISKTNFNHPSLSLDKKIRLIPSVLDNIQGELTKETFQESFNEIYKETLSKQFAKDNFNIFNEKLAVRLKLKNLNNKKTVFSNLEEFYSSEFIECLFSSLKEGLDSYFLNLFSKETNNRLKELLQNSLDHQITFTESSIKDILDVLFLDENFFKFINSQYKYTKYSSNPDKNPEWVNSGDLFLMGNKEFKKSNKVFGRHEDKVNKLFLEGLFVSKINWFNEIGNKLNNSSIRNKFILFSNDTYVKKDWVELASLDKDSFELFLKEYGSCLTGRDSISILSFVVLNLIQTIALLQFYKSYENDLSGIDKASIIREIIDFLDANFHYNHPIVKLNKDSEEKINPITLVNLNRQDDLKSIDTNINLTDTKFKESLDKLKEISPVFANIEQRDSLIYENKEIDSYLIKDNFNLLDLGAVLNNLNTTYKILCKPHQVITDSWDSSYEFFQDRNFSVATEPSHILSYLLHLRKKINIPSKEFKSHYITAIGIDIFGEKSRHTYFSSTTESSRGSFTMDPIKSLELSWDDVSNYLTILGGKLGNSIFMQPNSIVSLFYLTNFFNDISKAISIPNNILIAKLSESFNLITIVYELQKFCKKNKGIFSDFIINQLKLNSKSSCLTEEQKLDLCVKIFHDTFYKFESLLNKSELPFSEKVIENLFTNKKVNTVNILEKNILEDYITLITSYFSSLKEIKEECSSTKKYFKELTSYKLGLELKKDFVDFKLFINEQNKLLNSVYLEKVLSASKKTKAIKNLLDARISESIQRHVKTIPAFIKNLSAGINSYEKSLKDNFKPTEQKSPSIIDPFYGELHPFETLIEDLNTSKKLESIEKNTKRKNTLKLLDKLFEGDIEKKFTERRIFKFPDLEKVFQTTRALIGTRDKAGCSNNPKKLYRELNQLFDLNQLALKEFSIFKDSINGKEIEFIEIIKIHHPSLLGVEKQGTEYKKNSEKVFEGIEFKVESIQNINYWFAGNWSVCCMSFGEEKHFDYMFQKGFGIVNAYYKNRVVANSLIYTANNSSILILDNIEVAPNYKRLDINDIYFKGFSEVAKEIAQEYNISHIGVGLTYNDIDVKKFSSLILKKTSNKPGELLIIDDVNPFKKFYQDAGGGFYLIEGDEQSLVAQALNKIDKDLYIIDKEFLKTVEGKAEVVNQLREEIFDNQTMEIGERLCVLEDRYIEDMQMETYF